MALYLVTDFGRFHNRNPDIVALAARLGRSPNAVALKLSNLAALDASIPQKGMANASKMDRQVWAAYLLDPNDVMMAYQRYLLTTQPTEPPLRQPSDSVEQAFDVDRVSAGERRVVSTQRIGQHFFRAMVLTSYRRRCALTGIEDVRLLNASHIIAWKEDQENRLNPSNGICLNALHDRAFDRHLITFDEDYQMKISSQVPTAARKALQCVDTGGLELPCRFLPDQALLAQHRQLFYAQEDR